MDTELSLLAPCVILNLDSIIVGRMHAPTLGKRARAFRIISCLKIYCLVRKNDQQFECMLDQKRN